MFLEYLREYRTFFHISKSYGISESNCWEWVRWIENVLIKGKNSIFLLKNNLLARMLILKLCWLIPPKHSKEALGERHKKNSKNSILARKKGTQ